MAMESIVDQVQRAYISFYDRPADPAGLGYWVGRLEESGSLDSIISAFADSAEARSLYGGRSTDEMIESIYQQAFKRSPDDAGKSYWANRIDTGAVSEGGALLAIVEGAQGTDLDMINNKVTVSKHFTDLADDSGNFDEVKASEVLDAVTAEAKSVNEQISSITTSHFDELLADSSLPEYSDRDDEITGTDASDSINAGPGFDSVDGGQGYDLIIGGTGDDILKGGRGADYLEGGTGSDELYAGSYSSRDDVRGSYDDSGVYIPGYDVVTLDADPNVLKGGGGADKLYGGYGSDVLAGGDGADEIVGEEDGSYDLRSSDRFAEEYAERLYDDNIEGGAGEDTIRSGPGDDVIDGGLDRDNIRSGEGADLVRAGEGDDYVVASSRFNRLDDSADEIYGGPGDDQIVSLSGNDSVDGGMGDDDIEFERGSEGASGVIIAGEGSDQIDIDHDRDRVADSLLIDLSETIPARDSIELPATGRQSMPVEIKSYDLGMDAMELDYGARFNVVGARSSFDAESSSQDLSYRGDVITNHVQIVDSEETAWKRKAEDPQTPDDYGKGVFVIQGASAESANKSDVAEFIDDYGDDATYENEFAHYFLINVAQEGIGVYLFRDDTGADNNVVVDELTPVALLADLDTSQITPSNSDFFV